MPIYTMRCTVCEHEWDALKQVCAREAPMRCPECGRMALRKGIEGASLKFGAGFFNTGGY